MLLQKRDCSERFPNRTYREQGIRGQRYFGCEICITEDSGPERLCSVSKGQCHARDLVGNHVLANCSPQLTADWVDLKHISRSPSGTGRKARHTNAATLQECPASRQLTSTNWWATFVAGRYDLPLAPISRKPRPMPAFARVMEGAVAPWSWSNEVLPPLPYG